VFLHDHPVAATRIDARWVRDELVNDTVSLLKVRSPLPLLPHVVSPLMSSSSSAADPPQEYERERVPEHATKGPGSFWGM